MLCICNSFFFFLTQQLFCFVFAHMHRTPHSNNWNFKMIYFHLKIWIARRRWWRKAKKQKQKQLFHVLSQQPQNINDCSHKISNGFFFLFALFLSLSFSLKIIYVFGYWSYTRIHIYAMYFKKLFFFRLTVVDSILIITGAIQKMMFLKLQKKNPYYTFTTTKIFYFSLFQLNSVIPLASNLTKQNISFLTKWVLLHNR